MQGKDMCFSFNLETIYDHANFNINALDKVGITGVNGAGKTTLFNIILGNLKLDSGKLIITNNTRIGYLPQEIVINDDLSVYDYLLEGRPIKELESDIAHLYERISELTDNKEIDKLLKIIGKKQLFLESYDYYNYENILLNIIDKMHIDLDLLNLKVNDLSGGQKSKIAFARLLYANPDILLLDEPTNHLDIDTRSYIINYLKNYQEFMKKYKTLKELKERQIKAQEEERDRLRAIVLHYSNSSGNRKKMAQDREKKLIKLEQTMGHSEEQYKTITR